MVSSVGQCVALATFGEASCRGRYEELNWRDNPWFAYTETYAFGVGEKGGPAVASDPTEWIRRLPENGFVSAALFVEPVAPASDAYMRAGFMDGVRWAPVTRLLDGTEVVWHERSEFIKRGHTGVWDTYRGGFQVLPGQERIRATIESAALSLDQALAEVSQFQREYRPEEPFSEMFDAGRRQLRGRGLVPNPISPIEGGDEVYDRVRVLFPSTANPRAIAIIAAVEASWALGGMGWWDDWYCPDPMLLKKFQSVTSAYYSALLTALAAACEPAD